MITVPTSKVNVTGGRLKEDCQINLDCEIDNYRVRIILHVVHPHQRVSDIAFCFSWFNHKRIRATLCYEKVWESLDDTISDSYEEITLCSLEQILKKVTIKLDGSNETKPVIKSLGLTFKIKGLKPRRTRISAGDGDHDSLDSKRLEEFFKFS